MATKNIEISMKRSTLIYLVLGVAILIAVSVSSLTANDSPQDSTSTQDSTSPQDYQISACDTTCADCSDMYSCFGSFGGCFWNDSSQACASDPCRIISDNTICEGTPGCFWDTHEGPGECMKEIGGTDCAQWDTTGQAECDASPDCVWDNVTLLCNPTGGGSCTGTTCYNCMDYNPCVGAGCLWNASASPPGCEQPSGGGGDCSTNCPDCFDYGACLASAAGCDWNHTSFTCIEFTTTGDCQQACPDCSDQPTCEASGAGCTWDYSQWSCVGGSTVNCPLYNATLCGAYSNEGCNWNGTACTASDCQSECSSCDTDGPCMNSPAGCWWDHGMSTCNSGGTGGGTETCERGRCDICVDSAECTTAQSANPNCAWGLNEFGPNPNTPECFMNVTCNDDCYKCHNEADCAASPNSAFGGGTCDWDANSLTCYPSGMGGGGDMGMCDANCSLCPDSGMCGWSTAYCDWNSNTQACARDLCSSNCSTCSDSNNCYMSPLSCNWNGSSCVAPSCDTNCGECSQFGQTACNNSAAGCEWNASGQLCNWPTGNDQGCDMDCGTCTADWQCYASVKGCTWNYGDASCGTDNCMTDCSACDEWTCMNSFAGCFWDMYSHSCKGGAGGGGGGCMTCNEDCFNCNTNASCTASNDTCFSQSGCDWKYDPMKVMDPYATSNYTCMPNMFGGPGGPGTGDASCDSICEFCFTEAECGNATPTMAPPPGTCKWNTWDSMCHPEGGMGPGGGMGSACFMADGTSKQQCESVPGCVWTQAFMLCDPDFNDFGCSTTQGGMCYMCEDSTNCTNIPHCTWDDAGTPASTPDDYCRDNFDVFKFGGMCDSFCMDCFTQTDCNQSVAGCKWFADPMGFGPGWCDWNTTAGCDEDCFACFDNSTCSTSSNTNDPMNTGATSCAWDNNFWFCQPTGYSGEVCFAPGDEDGDGVEGCADSDCANDPFCFFGPMPGMPGGGGPMGMNINCFQWDQMMGGNQSICENYTNGTETGCAWHLVPGPGGMEGLCDPKFMDFVFGGMEMDAPPFFVLHDSCPKDGSDEGLNDTAWLDICDIGVKDAPNTTAFILDLGSVEDLALCNSVYSDSLNKTGKYWFFLDTDDNTSSGCSVNVSGLVEGGSTVADFNETGFEYALQYIVNYTANGTKEGRTAYECKNATQNKWGLLQATMSGKKDKACQHSSIFLGISKSDIGNPTKTIHIIGFTGNESTQFDTSASANLVNPYDRAYHAYYTPGTMDFKPPDCFNNPAACGSAFDMIGMFMMFEDCFPGTGDEDKDGKINCDDEDCFFAPNCIGQSAYDPANDTEAPTVTMNTVDAHSGLSPAFAMIFWTTNEPADGTVLFYGTNNTCENNIQNISQFDDPFFTMDDYRPFHDVALDSDHPDASRRLSSALSSGVTYFYKTVSCDQATYANGTANPNCAFSACLNFTTPLACGSYTNQTACVTAGSCTWDNSTNVCDQGFSFGFGFTPPWGLPPTSPTGNLDFQVDTGAGFQDMTGNETYNATSGATLKLTNPNTTMGGVSMPWEIDLINCSLARADEINLTGMMNVNTTNETTNESLFVGMDSDRWFKIQQTLGCTHVQETIPGQNIDCSNVSVGYCSSTGENCTNMIGDNVTILSCNASEIVVEMPARSDLFSSYTIQTGDESAPRISSITSPTSSNTSLTITWTTNENSSSTVNLGINASDLNITAVNATWSTSHSVAVTGLVLNTTYYYQVSSTDVADNTRTDNNSGSFHSAITSGGIAETQSIELLLGWNLISIPVQVT